MKQSADESIVIKMADGADATLTLRELFVNGPIEVILLGSSGRRFKIGIVAPRSLSIQRTRAADGSQRTRLDEKSTA